MQKEVKNNHPVVRFDFGITLDNKAGVSPGYATYDSITRKIQIADFFWVTRLLGLAMNSMTSASDPFRHFMDGTSPVMVKRNILLAVMSFY